MYTVDYTCAGADENNAPLAGAPTSSSQGDRHSAVKGLAPKRPTFDENLAVPVLLCLFFRAFESSLEFALLPPRARKPSQAFRAEPLGYPKWLPEGGRIFFSFCFFSILMVNNSRY